jgi:pimeloyl-ACP methyl ester carboxylesterase
MQAMKDTALLVKCAIEQDSPLDKEFPCSTEAIKIMAKDGSALNGLLYGASGAGVHPTLLLFHGYPGGDDNRDIAQAVRRMGWNVVVFHYRGLWGSEGAFSFVHAIEDASAALHFLDHAEHAQRYKIDRDRLAVLGHSMGGFLALSLASTFPDRLLGVGSIAGVNLAELATAAMTIDGRNAVKAMLETGAPVAGATPDTLTDELMAHRSEWDINTYAGPLKDMPVLLITAIDPFAKHSHAFGEWLRATGNESITEIDLDADHNFNSHRIALQTAVLEWLCKFTT